MSHSRRTFVKQLSAVTAAGLIIPRARREWWARPVNELMPEADEATLRAVALAAVEAARAAGADFADVRVASGRQFGASCRLVGSGIIMGRPNLSMSTGFGVRALVNGAWGFAADVDLTVDAAATAARTAVALARGNARRHGDALELAPADVVADGRWNTPVAGDPFAVSIREQVDLYSAALLKAPRPKEVEQSSLGAGWRDISTVFASTAGSVITQRLGWGGGGGSVIATVGSGRWDSGGATMPELQDGGPYGFETLARKPLVDHLARATERAIASAHVGAQSTSVEVGRYDLVFSPRAAGLLIVQTLAEALNVERVLGYRANGVGTSYAAPPDQMLGTFQTAAKSITIRADRNRVGGAATVGWDDEGVAPEPHTIVQNGVITDYLTNRETAPQLAFWYKKRGAPVRSHGCMRRGGAWEPAICIPNLTLEPGPGSATEEDLVKDVKRGLYIEYWNGGTDQQVVNTQAGSHYSEIRYIKNGKLANHVRDTAFQFLTVPFWKGVDAIGGAESVRAVKQGTDTFAYNDATQGFPESTVEAAPFRVRQINVLNTGRTA